MNFAAVKELSSYNMILGRPTLNALRAVYFTLHLRIKFSTLEGVVVVSGDPEVAQACYIATLKGKERLVAQTTCLYFLELVEQKEKLGTNNELVEVSIIKNMQVE